MHERTFHPYTNVERGSILLPYGDAGWAFKISNNKLYELTQSQPIEDLCNILYLKYIAHVCRMPNDAI